MASAISEIKMGVETVLVIGCGVSGPVMALLLKKQGYKPIVLEKVTLGDIGGSLMMMPNGLKVLDLVGIAGKITKDTPHLGEFRDQTYLGEDLGFNYLPGKCVENYGQPLCGVRRTTITLVLRDALIENEIPLYQGWKLAEIEETEHSVVAISEGGQKIEGSFLVGCDGIKGGSRSILLKKRGDTEKEAEYTGLTQIAGFSPTPSALAGRPGMLNMYGPGSHFIVYPMAPGQSGWAFTQRESEKAKETWRPYTIAETIQQKENLLRQYSQWSSPVPELISESSRMLKFGIYDRPELSPEQWYHNRCVLIGDAAHPTSPHLGQGANQALEDCYHLSKLLPKWIEGSPPISQKALTDTFSRFAAIRQPRTAALVKGARVQGDRRVVDGGIAACQERDEILREGWKDTAAVEAKYDYIFREPLLV